MSYYLILFSLFFLISLTSIVFYKKEPSLIILISIGFLLILTAGLRGSRVDRDYENYEMLYSNYKQISILLVEPTFVLVSSIVKNLFQNNIVFLFLIYAFMGVTVKFCAIKQLSQFCYLSVLIYLSNYFLLHEMTQIRGGVAAGFLLFCIKPIYDRNLLKFLFFLTLALCFHYSSIVFLPFYFLSSKKINVLLYLSILIVTYVLHFLNIHFTSLFYLVPADNLQFKLEANKKLIENNLQEGVNVFNLLQVMRILFSFFFLWKRDLIQAENKYFIIMLKIYFFALCAMVIFSDIPTFAVRTSELLAVVEIILFPMIIYTIRERKVASIFTIMLSLGLFCTNLFYTKLLIFK